MTTVARAVLELATDAGAFFADLDKAEARGKSLEGSFEHAGKSLQQFGKESSNAGKTLSLSLTAPIAAVVGGLSALAMSTASTGNEIAKSAREAGLSAGSFQELQFAIGQVAKVSDQEVTNAFAKMTDTIGEAAKGTTGAVETLMRLGFTQQEIASGTLETEAVFERFNLAMQGTDSAAQRAALAGDLVGDRLGKKLAGALHASGGQVDVLRGQFGDLGLGMSDDALSGAEAFTDALDVLKRQFGAATREIGSAFLPILTDTLIPLLRDRVVPAVRGVAEWIGKLIQWFANLPAPVQIVIGAITGLLAAIGPVLLIVGQLAMAIGAILPVLGPVAAALAAFATGPVALIAAAIAGLVAIWWAWGDDIKEATGSALGWVVDQFVWMKDMVVGAVQAVVGWIADLFGGVPDILLPLLGPIGAIVLAFRHWDEIVEIARSVYLGIKEWIVDKFGWLVDAVGEKVAKVTGFFSGMWRKVFGGDEVEAAAADVVKATEETVVALDTQTSAKGRAASAGIDLTRSLKDVKAATKESEKAQKDAAKAAEEQARQIENLRSKFSSFGVVTEIEVNRRLSELLDIQQQMIADGVPLQRVARALQGEFQRLGKDAERAGVKLLMLDGAIQQNRQSLGEIPPLLQAQGLSLEEVSAGWQQVSLDQLKAKTDANLLEGAYKTLGITSRAELAETARKAKEAYDTIATSGVASSEDIELARKKMVEAERIAAGETVSIWETAFGTLTGTAKGVLGEITNLVRDTSGTLSRIGRDFVSTIGNTLFPGLGTLISNAWPLIEKGIDQIWSAVQGLARGIASVFSGIARGFGALLNLFGSGADRSVAPFPGQPGETAPDFENPNNPGFNPNDPNNPHGAFDPGNPDHWLGDGGIVTRPMVAGIGDVPEAVIPLDRMGELLRGHDQALARAIATELEPVLLGRPAVLIAEGREIARTVFRSTLRNDSAGEPESLAGMFGALARRAVRA